jgi:hypothetical protein
MLQDRHKKFLRCDKDGSYRVPIRGAVTNAALPSCICKAGLCNQERELDGWSDAAEAKWRKNSALKPTCSLDHVCPAEVSRSSCGIIVLVAVTLALRFRVYQAVKLLFDSCHSERSSSIRGVKT